MSRALTALRHVLDRLTPIDAAMARGLSAKEIERLRDDLAFVEKHLADLEDEIEEREIDRLMAESERTGLTAEKARQ